MQELLLSLQHFYLATDTSVSHTCSLQYVLLLQGSVHSTVLSLKGSVHCRIQKESIRVKPQNTKPEMSPALLLKCTSCFPVKWVRILVQISLNGVKCICSSLNIGKLVVCDIVCAKHTCYRGDRLNWGGGGNLNTQIFKTGYMNVLKKVKQRGNPVVFSAASHQQGSHRQLLLHWTAFCSAGCLWTSACLLRASPLNPVYRSLHIINISKHTAVYHMELPIAVNSVVSKTIQSASMNKDHLNFWVKKWSNR